ncbi:STAS domain-containing protein [Micromonospora sp. NPDC047738]|uniref:STAS domain-containing protein n=1 Tax=Micromonospora sp. NPDC047738 TaxID=3155741 RepID=UPI0033C304D1
MRRWLVSRISGSKTRAPQWGPGRLGWSQRRVDGALVIHLAGELDLSTAAELHRRLMSVVESSAAATVVLDMSHVAFIDAHSTGLIVTAWAAATCRGRQFQVNGLQGIPARVFGLLGFAPLAARRMWDDNAGGVAGGPSEGAGGVAAR